MTTVLGVVVRVIGEALGVIGMIGVIGVISVIGVIGVLHDPLKVNSVSDVDVLDTSIWVLSLSLIYFGNN